MHRVFTLIAHERELPDDVQLQEGYDLEGNKVKISAEQAALVREMINREQTERFEEAVRKALVKYTSDSKDGKG